MQLQPSSNRITLAGMAAHKPDDSSSYLIVTCPTKNDPTSSWEIVVFWLKGGSNEQTRAYGRRDPPAVGQVISKLREAMLFAGQGDIDGRSDATSRTSFASVTTSLPRSSITSSITYSHPRPKHVLIFRRKPREARIIYANPLETRLE
jgi:hypothetical protein